MVALGPSITCPGTTAAWAAGARSAVASTAARASGLRGICGVLSRAGPRTTLTSLALPVHRTGREQVARERAPEHVAHRAARLEQPLDVDAGVVAHLVKHRDKVLRGDVAGGALGYRAAAQLAERGLERAHAGIERRHHIGKPLSARVVEVRGQLDAVEPLKGALEELANLARIGHAGGIAERPLLAARRGQPLGDPEHALRRHL